MTATSRNKAWILLFALVLLLFECPLEAAELLQTNKPIREWIRDRSPTSGADIAGLMFHPGNTRPNSAKLFVHLSERQGTRLCINIVSRDAYYLAQLEYNISKLPAGTYRLSFLTQYEKIIQQYQARHFAVLAEIKADCSPAVKTNALAAVSWNAPTELDRLVILINAGGHGARLVIPKGGGMKTIAQCKEATGDLPRIAFDTECETDLIPNVKRYDFEIEITRYFNLLRKVELPVILP